MKTLRGGHYQQIHEALLDGYPTMPSLRQLVLYELDTALETIAGGATVNEMIFNLIQWAGAQGCLEELVIGAQKQNPGNAGLQKLVAEMPDWIEDPQTTVPFAQEEAAEPAPGEPPYQGLEFFDVDDVGRFFGREELTQKLIQRIEQENFLAIIGASGSGKSSLVRAGVVAQLKQRQLTNGSQRPIDLIIPTSQPIERLATSLTRTAESVRATSTLIDDMRNEPRSLHLHVRRLLEGKPPEERMLLVVDQFEELFSLCRELDEQQAFVDNLLTAVEEGSTSVILTLRADFYADCARFDNLRSALTKHQEYIGRMNEAELRQAIEKPAKVGGWSLEEGLVDLLLKDVGDEPGNLPLLSYALQQTWLQRHGRMMTISGYLKVGGIKGAIADRADTVLKQMTPEEQRLVRRIFIRLTELGEGKADTRRRVMLSELQTPSTQPEMIERVLQEMSSADARLIVMSKGESADDRQPSTNAAEPDESVESQIEVAHEALIREWPTLRTWLDQNRDDLRTQRQLTEACREWDPQNSDASLLHRGTRLQQALTWDAANPDELNQKERAFLDASVAEQKRQDQEKEQQQQERERLQREREEALQGELTQAKAARSQARRAALASLIAALAVIGVSIYGYIEYRDSQRQYEADKKIADSQALVIEARGLTKELEAEAAMSKLTEAKELNPSLELDLAAESKDIRRTVAISLTLQGEELLRTARESDDRALWETSVVSATALFTQAFAVKPPPEAAVYVRIPAGEIRLGEVSSEDPVQINEFWMHRTEVTKAQYKLCESRGYCSEPSDAQYDDERFQYDPIVGVTWHQANEYAQWVGGRLPTEAEWEYACRGGDDRVYPWGDDEPSIELLNYSGSPGSSTVPVGSYPKGVSPFGLYDMVGNVWEWGADELSGDRRPLRGGSFANFDFDGRCAYRYDNSPYFESGLLGFRVVVDVSPGFWTSGASDLWTSGSSDLSEKATPTYTTVPAPQGTATPTPTVTLTPEGYPGPATPTGERSQSASYPAPDLDTESNQESQETDE